MKMKLKKENDVEKMIVESWDSKPQMGGIQQTEEEEMQKKKRRRRKKKRCDDHQRDRREG